MKILMVLTSHDQLGDTGNKTGFWLEEFAAPYYVFVDAGAEVTLASPVGGQPPMDPTSDTPDFRTEATERFKDDSAAREALANTRPLAEVSAGDYDAVFYPGGHGPLWDLAEDVDSIRLLEQFNATGKVISTVCHAPAALRHVRTPEGAPLVRGRAITGFSDSEEAAVGLTEVVPFRVEAMLREQGAHYSKDEDWSSHVVVDGRLITGQNPASSAAAAEAVVQCLQS